VSKSADPDQTLRGRRSGWSGSTLFAYVLRSLFAWRWPYMFVWFLIQQVLNHPIFYHTHMLLYPKQQDAVLVDLYTNPYLADCDNSPICK